MLATTGLATLAALAALNGWATDVALGATATGAPSSQSQGGGRENPFLPQPTEAEDKDGQMRGVIERTVRRMIPEILQAGEDGFEREKAETIEEVRRQAAQQAQLNASRASAPVEKKNNLKFISCIRGKALYKDASTNTRSFAKPGSEAQQICDPQ